MVALVDAEAQFIKSMTEGSLESFQQSWNDNLNNLTTQPMDASLSDLAYSTACRIQYLATQFLDIYEERSQLEASFTADVQSLFEELSLNDANSPTPGCQPSPDHSSESPIYPPYIAPAYEWLLRNVHNPYPSKRQKSLISRETSTSLQHIDTWFLNVRRRIGWTAISKNHFAGSKADTVAAAKRALIEDEHQVGITAGDPLPANIRMAFVQMEAAAKELYSDKFTKSALAGKLDGLVKDMKNKDVQRKRRSKPRVKEQAGLKPVGGEQLAQGGSVDDGASELRKTPLVSTTPPLTPEIRLTGKRRAPDSDDDSELDSAARLFQPRKRSRVLSTSSSCSSISSLTSSLFSPSSSRANTPSPVEPKTPSLPCSGDFFIRDRYCTAEPSSGDTMGIRPRLHLTSDPLPNVAHNATTYSTPCSSPSSTEPSPLFGGSYELNNYEWSSIFFDTPESAVLGDLDISSFHAPEIFCAPEMAPVFYPDDIDIHALVPKDHLSCTPISQPNLLDQIWHDEPGYPLISNCIPSPTVWSNNVSHSLNVQTSTTFCSPCKVIPVDTPSTTLPVLDELSSLTSLPNELASKIPPQHDSVKSIDWLSIFPDTLTSTAIIDGPGTGAVGKPSETALAKPISITPAQRAAKLTRLHSLITQARQLEAELEHP